MLNVAQILQGPSYKVCSTMSPIISFSFGLLILVFDTPPLHTSSLLLCYEGILNSFVAVSIAKKACLYVLQGV